MAEFTNFFQGLLVPHSCDIKRPKSFVCSQGCSLSAEQSQALNVPFFIEEAKSTLFSLNPRKALGPNGYTASSYQDLWGLIRDGREKPYNGVLIQIQ